MSIQINGKIGMDNVYSFALLLFEEKTVFGRNSENRETI